MTTACADGRRQYGEMQCTVKAEVAKAKHGAYDDLHARLDSKEGGTDLYRWARQRERQEGQAAS